MKEYMYRYGLAVTVCWLTLCLAFRIVSRFVSSLEARRQRPPDRVIGDPQTPYMRRWYIIPRNRWFNVYLHEFQRSDDDRALHDHPWASLSIALSGIAQEQYMSDGTRRLRVVRAGDILFRWAKHTHRMIIENGPFVTLFITGPITRNWGFWCPRGWIRWQEFHEGGDPDAGGGKGCD